MYQNDSEAPASSAATNSDHRTVSPSSACSYFDRIGMFGVRSLDALLRLFLGIGEFSRRSDCVLRFAARKSPATVVLPQAIAIAKGEPILELHLWNEHLGHCRHEHEGLLGWSLCVERRVRLSLMLLADHMVIEAPTNYSAVHATILISSFRSERLLRDLGFTLLHPPPTMIRRLGDALKGVLVAWLVWAYRPYRGRRRKRTPFSVDLWMSRSQFQRLYGRPAHALESRP